MHPFHKYLNTISPVSKESWEALYKLISTKTVAPKTEIIEIAKKPESVFFLLDGFARSYTITHKGDEHNTELYGSYELLASFSAMMKNKNSTIGISSISECKLYYINVKDWLLLSKQYDDIANIYVVILERLFIKFEKRAVRLLTMEATERYLCLKKRLKGVDANIKQYNIASYLGITPIQFSRIKTKLKN